MSGEQSATSATHFQRDTTGEREFETTFNYPNRWRTIRLVTTRDWQSSGSVRFTVPSQEQGLLEADHCTLPTETVTNCPEPGTKCSDLYQRGQ